MNRIIGVLIVFYSLISCNSKIYLSNGETIYKTGKNINGEALLDKKASSIKFVNKCITCHGKKGNRMKNKSVRFNDLTDSNKYSIPYNDTLFFRFLDHDIKSDGTKANIGLKWKMNDKDKNDLLDYLKSL